MLHKNTLERSTPKSFCRLLKGILYTLPALSLMGASLVASAQVNVLTNRYDNGRTGRNLGELLLTPANVNATNFGKLFTIPVDAVIFAQPLYVSNLNIPGKGVHNTLFVTTVNNTVYAFDADSNTGDNALPLWQTSLSDPDNDIHTPLNSDFNPRWSGRQTKQGTISTPVIDLSTNTLYLVALTKDGNDTVAKYQYRIHALDITTGAQKPNSPQIISAQVPGTGYDKNASGKITFNALNELQRPGLLLLNGVVYIAFGSVSDRDSYHGWVLGYDATTLQQVSVFNPTANGRRGGFWGSGTAPAADEQGNIYVMTGNGTYSTVNKNYGNSFIKLSTAGNSLTAADYFTPYNQAAMDAADADLGSSSPLVVPGTDYIVGGGKPGRLYLLDRNNMGKFNPLNDNNAFQSFPAATAHIHGTPTFWDSPNGTLFYVWGEYSYLNAYRMVDGMFVTTPFKTSPFKAPNGMPGGFLSVSANGNTPGTGIVWAALPFQGDALVATVPGVLRAYDAATLTPIWHSRMNTARDDFGMFARFCPPTIANGKVYMATFSGRVVVYGLLSNPAAPAEVPAPTIAPNGARFPVSRTVTLQEATPGALVYYTLDGTDPTTASTLYTGPFTLTDDALVKARAFKSGLADSKIASAQFRRSVDLVVAQDTYVRSGIYANATYGGATVLPVKRDSLAPTDWNRFSYLRLDLSGIATDPVQATLRLRLDSSSRPANATMTLSVYQIDDASWTENGITWNNAPFLDRTNVLSTGTLVTKVPVKIVAGSTIEIDLTAFVQANKGQKVSLMLANDSVQDVMVAFLSRESSVGKPSLALK